VKFLYNKLNTYDLQGDEYRQEENIIRYIMHNNSFPIHPPKTHPQTKETPVELTSSGKQMGHIHIRGKVDNLHHQHVQKNRPKIAFRTVNTIRNALTRNTQTTDKYTQSGVYKLACPDCKKAYVVQTGRNFTIRFREHINAFKNNNHSSKYARHLIEQNHTLDSIQNTMQVLQYQNKGAHLDPYERFHIYTEYVKENHLNDEHAIFPNKLFDTLLKTPQ
jgi:hypothetical protein